MFPEVDEIWRTKVWRTRVRYVRIDKVDLEVSFTFLDDNEKPGEFGTTCGMTAFLRTYDFDEEMTRNAA